MELLKQYLGLLVPCVPGEVAKNAEFRWLASMKSKQQAYMKRTLGEREPASCHLESSSSEFKTETEASQLRPSSHHPCHFIT